MQQQQGTQTAILLRGTARVEQHCHMQTNAPRTWNTAAARASPSRWMTVSITNLAEYFSSRDTTVNNTCTSTQQHSNARTTLLLRTDRQTPSVCARGVENNTAAVSSKSPSSARPAPAAVTKKQTSKTENPHLACGPQDCIAKQFAYNLRHRHHPRQRTAGHTKQPCEADGRGQAQCCCHAHCTQHGAGGKQLQARARAAWQHQQQPRGEAAADAAADAAAAQQAASTRGGTGCRR